MVSDATIVAALASTVVFVVKANATPHQLVRQSLRKLGAALIPSPERAFRALGHLARLDARQEGVDVAERRRGPSS